MTHAIIMSVFCNRYFTTLFLKLHNDGFDNKPIMSMDNSYKDMDKAIRVYVKH